MINASNDVTISNVKIVGGRVQNDDGMDFCNSNNIHVNDCFIRTDDDCIAFKGLETYNGNVENITITNSILWCDRARIFLLGHESRADYMRNISVSNCDIIHYAMTPFLLEPGEEMTIENVLFENFRINRTNQTDFITLRPTINQYMKKQVPGRIRNCTFRNIQIDSSFLKSSNPIVINVQGYDANHTVEDITFENIAYLGSSINSDTKGVSISGSFTNHIYFLPKD